MINTLIQIQNDYLNLLEQYISNQYDNAKLIFLDDIQCFWYKNRNMITSIADNIFHENIPYIITGVSYYILDETEQYIISLSNSILIFDDPFPDYLSQLRVSRENEKFESFNRKMEEIIDKGISLSISLLKNEKNSVFIIPMRHLFSFDKLNINVDKIISDFFLIELDKLPFSGNLENEEVINENNLRNILLFEYDNPSYPIETRISDLFDYIPFEFPTSLNKYEKLRSILFGNISQTIHIVISSIHFNTAPLFKSFRQLHEFVYIIDFLINPTQDELIPNEYIDKLKCIREKSIKGYFTLFEINKRKEEFDIEVLKKNDSNTSYKSYMEMLEITNDYHKLQMDINRGLDLLILEVD